VRNGRLSLPSIGCCYISMAMFGIGMTHAAFCDQEAAMPSAPTALGTVTVPVEVSVPSAPIR
jgi:hypothetical protein